MVAANARWSGRNDTLADATGQSPRDAIEARCGMAEPRALGGIRDPRRRELAVGTPVARFDGTSRPSLAAGGNGGWNGRGSSG